MSFECLVDEFLKKNESGQTDTETEDYEATGHINQGKLFGSRIGILILHSALVNIWLIEDRKLE